MKTISDFTEGPILGPLLKFAFPILFAMFLQTITFVITGISLGDTIILGQKIGEKNLRKAEK